MCLLLGAVGAGKTLLLKRLQKITTNGSISFTDGLIPSTVPTVGTNLVNLTLDKRKQVTVRELGGAMAPIWPTYLSDCGVVIFMVDASNSSQLSASSILLFTTLASDHLQDTTVLILLNKIDLASRYQLSEVKYVMRIDDLVKNARQRVSLLEVCVKDGRGLKQVIQWLSENDAMIDTSVS